MTVKVPKRKPATRPPTVRQAFIPHDLSYMTETEFGKTMTHLVAEIAEEQGTRSTEEINRLIELMRTGKATNADVS